MPEEIKFEGNDLQLIVREVVAEYYSATSQYGPFSSAHEGFAVLLEEVDELKAEVWKSPKKRDIKAMRAEAIQVAAMAIRFISDCAEEKP